MSLFYAVYLSHHNIPRKKYQDLASAIIDAGDISKKKNTPAFIIEYSDKPVNVCRCNPDGTMEQL